MDWEGKRTYLASLRDITEPFSLEALVSKVREPHIHAGSSNANIDVGFMLHHGG